MKKTGIALACLFSTMAFAGGPEQIDFKFDYDLMKAPMADYTQWCFINLEKDHWDLEKEQDEKDRARVMIRVPHGATGIQITGKSPRKCFCNEGAEMAFVPSEPTLVGNLTHVRFQVQYWGDPLKVFIGWKFDGKVTKRGRVTQCRSFVQDPGSDDDLKWLEDQSI